MTQAPPEAPPLPTSPEASPGREAGYPEALASLGGLWLGGFVFQAMSESAIPLMAPTTAALLVFLPVVALFALGAFFKDHPLVRFLAGVPFGITALACTSLGALLGTLVIQKPLASIQGEPGFLDRLAISDVFHSYWFGGLVLALMLCLVLSAGRRSRVWNLKNSVFHCTHLGTAIILAGGLFGNLTSQSGMLVLEMGRPEKGLQMEDGSHLDLPSPLTLKAFSVDPAPLEVAMGRGDQGEAKPKRGGRSLPSIEKGKAFKLKGWTITCLEAIPSAEVQSRLLEDPSGVLALDLQLQSHGTQSPLTLLANGEALRFPGGMGLGLMEVPEGHMDNGLAQAKAGMEKDTSLALLFVSDGKHLSALKRKMGGGVDPVADASLKEGISLGPLALSVKRSFRARMDVDYKPASGLRMEPMGAAKVRAEKGQQLKEGWIAAGPMGSEWLVLEGKDVLMLMHPQPKTFESTLSANGQNTRIRVNHPMDHHGWQLTQTSWNVNENGSPVSILRAMKDPSIPVVWVGLLLLMLGTCGALWILPATFKGEAK